MIRLIVQAETRADDGHPSRRTYQALTPDQLPAETQIQSDIQGSSRGAAQSADCPNRTMGPHCFPGRAAAVFFHEVSATVFKAMASAATKARRSRKK